VRSLDGAAGEQPDQDGLGDGAGIHPVRGGSDVVVVRHAWWIDRPPPVLSPGWLDRQPVEGQASDFEGFAETWRAKTTIRLAAE